MGTTFDVAAYGQKPEGLTAAVNEVFDEIDRLDRQMSAYREDSELSYINRAAARRRVVVEPTLFGLIRDALRYSSETSGAFDITVGPLMRAWGFFRHQGRVPNDAKLPEMLQAVGYTHVKLDIERSTLWFDCPGVQLDLGGIGKGFAVERAAETLRSCGVTSALISSGTSTIYALGAPPNAPSWTVILRGPFDRDEGAEFICVKNSSVSTSGNYENFFRENGKTYSHILDPLAGRPVERMLSTTVLAQDTVETEVLSTAFFVMGPERASQYLATHPNLAMICYQTAETPDRFRRVVDRSGSRQLPSEVMAELGSAPPSDQQVRDSFSH
jgi:FAD:protein FMN transferase